MIDINGVFDGADTALNESAGSDICEFDRDTATLADVRDAVKAAQQDAFAIEPAENQTTAYVTCRDGEHQITFGEPGEAEAVPLDKASARDWKGPKALRAGMDKALDDIRAGVKGVDPELFGNGRCSIKCVMAPDEENDCFLAVFPEVAQFDAGMNRIGGSPDGAEQALAAMRKCPCCAKMAKEQVEALKLAQKCRDRLEALLGKLEKMADGMGWRCTLNQYVDDKYSRKIVNSAMQHGVDVSRGSQFVQSLSRRLAQSAARGKPTKSDLATYAKGDKIDFKSDACRSFLADMERDAQAVNDEVLGPVQDLQQGLARAASGLARAIAAFDKSKDAGRIIKETDAAGDAGAGRKALRKIAEYCGGNKPKTAVVGCNGKLYKLTSNYGGVAAIADLFEV